MLHSSMSLLDVIAWVAAASVKGTVLIGAVTLLRYWLAPATASTLRYALWLPVLVCLICPLGLHVGVTSNLRSNSDSTGGMVVSSILPHSERASKVADAPLPTVAAVRLQSPGEAHSFSFASIAWWLAVIWAVGTAVFGVVYLRNLLKFRRIRNAARAVEGSAAAILERCKAELSLRGVVTLLESPDIESPAIFGWWHPALLLPLGSHEPLGSARLRYVLLHELAHLKRNDILANWAIALAQLLHWFNPAVWLAARLVRSDMEAACDACVVRRLPGAERGEYGEMLVQFADYRGGAISPPYGLGIADRYTDLKGRLIMITRFRPAPTRIKAATGLAFMALTAVALIQPGFTSRAATSADAARTMQRGSSVGENSSPAGSSDRTGSVPMRALIEQVAANIHKRVVVDPRAAGSVILYGQRLDQITYPDFLTILRINKYTAIEVNDYINVVPIGEVRSMPLPAFREDRTLPDDQFAEMSVRLKNACAASLIPILRPLVAPYGDFVADVNSNTILAVETYASLKRMRSIITQLDASTKPRTECREARN